MSTKNNYSIQQELTKGNHKKKKHEAENFKNRLKIILAFVTQLEI